MPNPFKLEFTLKQHTPLIHFQHDQEGATLRATELKPKLDKFLIEKYKDDVKDFIKDTNDKDGSRSLDYKVKIELTKKRENSRPKFYLFGSLLKNYQKDEIRKIGFEPVDKSPYFADNEKIKNKDYQSCKIGIQHDENDFELKLIFTSLNTKLLQIIRTNIDVFFVLNNFGSRQSKGFGSFTTINVNSPQECEKILLSNTITTYYFIPTQNFFEIFKTINTENQELKSGTVSMGSGLVDYYLELNDEFVWDKMAIEQHFIDKKAKTQDWYFIRALLGLSSNHAYEKGKLSFLKSIDIKETTGAIERIASPIMFKVIFGRIYVFAKEINEEVYGKTFSFTPKQNTGVMGNLLLNTPNNKSKIDLDAFLNTYLNKKWKTLK